MWGDIVDAQVVERLRHQLHLEAARPAAEGARRHGVWRPPRLARPERRRTLLEAVPHRLRRSARQASLQDEGTMEAPALQDEGTMGSPASGREEGVVQSIRGSA